MKPNEIRDSVEPNPKPHSYGRSAILVGALTLCSRVSGVVRDGFLASLLGASLANDLFQLCFELPNLARRVAGDSSLAPLALPLRAEAERRHGRPGVEALAARGGLLFLGAGLAMALLAILAAPWIVRGFLPASEALARTPAGAEVLGRAALLVRIASLFLGALLAASFLSALLQGERDFLVPALGGLPLNLLLIALAGGSLWMAGPSAADSPEAFLADGTAWKTLLVLAWGVAAGGFLRLGLTLAGLARLGFRPRWEPGLGGELKKRAVRAVPLLLVMAVPQLYASVHLLLISADPFEGAEGALSALRYAHRVMEFPLALVAGALAATTLPAMLDGASGGRSGAKEEAARSLSVSLRRFFLLGIPSAAGLAALALPTVALLFQRGAWSASDSAECARYLAAWALALVPLGACFVIAPAGLAFAGVRPMLRDGMIALALGTATSWALYRTSGDPAWLPLGVVPAEAWRTWSASRRIGRALGSSPGAGAGAFFLPLAASGAMAGALAWAGAAVLPAEVVAEARTLALAPRLAGAIALGAGCYFAVLGALAGFRGLLRKVLAKGPGKN